jgi:hypothetical protein
LDISWQWYFKEAPVGLAFKEYNLIKPGETGSFPDKQPVA